MNMCKVPTERVRGLHSLERACAAGMMTNHDLAQFFKEEMGLDMIMSPDFETYECNLR